MLDEASNQLTSRIWYVSLLCFRRLSSSTCARELGSSRLISVSIWGRGGLGGGASCCDEESAFCSVLG